MSRVSPDLLAYCCADIRAGHATVADCVAVHPEVGAELAELLALAAALTATPAIEPRAGFAERGRASLLATITGPGPSETRPWLRGQREALASLFGSLAMPRLARVAATLALVLFIMLALGGGAVYAAQAALPGDSLYALKLAGEDLRLRLSQPDLDRARLHLELADTRLSELQRLAAQNRFAAMNDLLPVYQEQLAQAERHAESVAFAGEQARQAELALLRARLRQQEQTLAKLQAGAPADVARGLALAAARAQGLPAVAEERWHVGTASAVTSGTTPATDASLDQMELALAGLASDPLLPGDSQKSLMAKIEAARQAVERGQSQVALSMLDAFRNELEAQYRAGHLAEANYQYLLSLHDQSVATVPPAAAPSEAKPGSPEKAATPAVQEKPATGEDQTPPGQAKLPPGQEKKQDNEGGKGPGHKP
ncbi:MAG: DUF5667 domain-containing protein [Chloroflexi bacterium]|nr:DUF5667 domain-containing protein [Chloroflexota bacterium]MCL5110341.1 DUF5667 domain-containing protein [Chloroflexota bacterium]